jgi:hypothetical protein
MVPTTLVADFGTVDISSLGIKAITGIDLDLEPGSYSLCFVLQQGCSMRYFQTIHQRMGASFPSTSFQTGEIRNYAPLSFASLPSTFPSGIDGDSGQQDQFFIQIGWSLL